MRRLVKQILIINLFIGIVSIFIQGCCTENLVVTGPGKLFAIDQSGSKVDTVHEAFYLTSKMDIEWVTTGVGHQILNVANATSCEIKYADPIDESSIRLSIDTSFLYNGVEIDRDSNFIEFTGLELSFDEPYAGYHIEFTKDFIDKSTFLLDSLNFDVSISTISGETFKNRKLLIVKF